METTVDTGASEDGTMVSNTSDSLMTAEEAAAQKREERLRKFRELHLKRNEARKLNHQEVVEEDKRLKLPTNWEAKKARLEWELKVEEKKKECLLKGEDYERVKLLEVSAEDAERFERKRKKRNPDLGFSDYAAAQLRQYQRLTKQIKPDLEKYEQLREESGEDFFPTSNSLLHGTHVPSKEGVDKMVSDLEKQLSAIFVMNCTFKFIKHLVYVFIIDLLLKFHFRLHYLSTLYLRVHLVFFPICFPNNIVIRQGFAPFK
uniref:Pre-mRNA-splicing factor SYF2 n=1 Tax=Naja naja TaxID=35670 RepID=A0A8C6XA51_NAJNA